MARGHKTNIAECSYVLRYCRDAAVDEEKVEEWKLERAQSRRSLRFYTAVVAAASSSTGDSLALPVRPIRRNRRGKGGKSAAAAAATQPEPLESAGV